MQTNVRINEETHTRLKQAKPFDSMSFDELIQDMLSQYEPPKTAINETSDP